MDYTVTVCLAMTRLNDADELAFEKAAALTQLIPLMRAYEREGIRGDLLQRIAAKKAEFIFGAEKKSELKEILAQPKVHYDYNKIKPVGRFHILEEELIYWSWTSLKAPLVEYGYERYLEVFNKVFPDIKIN